MVVECSKQTLVKRLSNFLSLILVELLTASILEVFRCFSLKKINVKMELEIKIENKDDCKILHLLPFENHKQEVKPAVVLEIKTEDFSSNDHKQMISLDGN